MYFQLDNQNRFPEFLTDSWVQERHFYSLPFGLAEANIYQPKYHFNQPKKRFDEKIDFTVLLSVNNRIHWPDSQIHQPRAIGHYSLWTMDSQVKKSCILCLNFGEFRFPGSSQILFPVKIVCVFLNPTPHFGQIPDPKNNLLSFYFPQQQLKLKMKYHYWVKC